MSYKECGAANIIPKEYMNVVRVSNRLKRLEAAVALQLRLPTGPLTLDYPILVSMLDDAQVHGAVRTEHPAVYPRDLVSECALLRAQVKHGLEEIASLKEELSKVKAHLQGEKELYSNLSRSNLEETEALQELLVKEKKLKNYYNHQFQAATKSLQATAKPFLPSTQVKPVVPSSQIKFEEKQGAREITLPERPDLYDVTSSSGGRISPSDSITSHLSLGPPAVPVTTGNTILSYVGSAVSVTGQSPATGEGWTRVGSQAWKEGLKDHPSSHFSTKGTPLSVDPLMSQYNTENVGVTPTQSNSVSLQREVTQVWNNSKPPLGGGVTQAKNSFSPLLAPPTVKPQAKPSAKSNSSSYYSTPLAGSTKRDGGRGSRLATNKSQTNNWRRD